MNLSACVNVVLYDRLAKERKSKLAHKENVNYNEEDYTYELSGMDYLK